LPVCSSFIEWIDVGLDSVSTVNTQCTARWQVKAWHTGGEVKSRGLHTVETSVKWSVAPLTVVFFNSPHQVAGGVDACFCFRPQWKQPQPSCQSANPDSNLHEY